MAAVGSGGGMGGDGGSSSGGGRRGREERRKKRLDEILLSAPNQYAKYLSGNQIAIMFSFPRWRICLMKRRQIRPAERVCRSR